MAELIWIDCHDCFRRKASALTSCRPDRRIASIGISFGMLAHPKSDDV